MIDDVASEFWQGVALFNQREFYDCHDVLEAIWIEANDPQKTFYQGILQIAVAFYHLGNQNLRGATILLGEGMHRLRRYQPVYAGVDVTALLSQCLEWLVLLQQATPEQIPELARQIQSPQIDSVEATLALPLIATMTSDA